MDALFFIGCFVGGFILTFVVVLAGIVYLTGR